MQFRRIVPILIAAILAIPAATATWYVHGTYEPDTAQDAADGYMYADPDRSPSGRRAYFNAWADEGDSGVNPNAGLLGSRVYGAPTLDFYAMLGVWRDCNGDGFVGMADGALWEYSDALLPNRDVCPETGGPESHVRGGWVWEFHWIGPADDVSRGGAGQLESFGAAGIVNDTGARVWHDWGLPGELPGRTCTIALQPGATGSTGGAIDHVDCLIGRRIQSTVNAVDPNCDLALGSPICFGEGRPQRSSSLLNQQVPHLWHDPYHPDSTGLYERSSGDAAFQTYDCSKDRSQVDSGLGKIAVKDETGAIPDTLVINGITIYSNLKEDDGSIIVVDRDGVLYNYTEPEPSVKDPTQSPGSFYDGFNNTADGALDSCDTSDGNNEWTWVNAETASGAVDPNFAPRARHSTAFHFEGAQAIAINHGAVGDCTGTSGGRPFPPGCETGYMTCIIVNEDGSYGPPGCDQPPFPKTADILTQDDPDDFGIQFWRNGLGVGWKSTSQWSDDPQLVDRATLQPRGPIFSTFYAALTEQSLATGVTVPGGTGIYGAEWCHGATSGAYNGFDCDASHWWNPRANSGSTTSPMPERQGANAGFPPIDSSCSTGRVEPVPNCRELGVKAGQPYQLRDIDCWDGTLVRGVPARASLVDLSGQPACVDA